MSHQETPSPATAATDAKRKRLQELREKQAERALKQEQEALDRELVEAELEEKYLSFGQRGVHFEIIGSPDGFVVVKLGDWLPYKKFLLGKRVNDAPIPEDVVAFALANLVYPERDKAVAIFDRYGGVATRCANALVAMHQGEAAERRGK